MKRGITVAMLVVMVAVLGILATVTVKSISNSYTNSRLSVWATEIGLIQDLVKENKDDLAYALIDTVSFDVSAIPQEIKTVQFEGETITSNKITLKEINLAALGVNNAIYGIHKDGLDKYAYSETTGRVYYLKGIDARVNVYYTLTEELKNRYGANLTVSNLSLISFEQSEIELTNKAIKVTVKVPKTYTNISVTTSNSSISVGSRVTEDTKYTYLVNNNGIKGNYTITVTYTEGGTTKNVKHLVDNYDGVAPTVSGLTQSNLIYNETATKIEDYMINVTATDASQVVMFKYVPGTIAQSEANSYFEKNGVNIIKTGKIMFEEDINNYTIYVKDQAGNVATIHYTRPVTTYAIYSVTDNSFRLIATPKGIKQGGLYNGRTITNLYSGFENTVYSSETNVPWYSIRSSVKTVIVEDKITSTSTRMWFKGFNNCTTFDVTNFDASKTTNLSYMFDGAGSSESITKFRITGLEKFDTSNVTLMHAMFNHAGRYATDWNIGDLSGFKTSKVTRMDSMFNRAGENATKFNIGNLDNWNTGNVTTFSNMFYMTGANATVWNIGKLTNWNTANANSIAYMFYGSAGKVTSLDIGNLGTWNTAKVTTAAYMFGYFAKAATSVYIGDLSNWNTSRLTNMDYMFFYFCNQATTFDIGDIGNWDVSNVTNMNRVFRSAAYKSTTMNMPNFANWDVSNVTNMEKMFTAFGVGSTWKLDLTPWNVWKVTTHIDFSAEMREGKIIEPYWVNTLGMQVASAKDYGKTVNYVSDNGITGWKVFYHTSEYVYLIASQSLDYDKLPAGVPGLTYHQANLSGYNKKANVYWTSSTVPSTAATIQNPSLWMANWSDYNSNTNAKCSSYFLCETYWTGFKNTKSSYASYVVGAIATPTIEMFVASWNAKRNATGDTTTYPLEYKLTVGKYGYLINEKGSITIGATDSLYVWLPEVSGASVWLAGPQSDAANYSTYVSRSKNVAGYPINQAVAIGIRPVVCLKVDTPAMKVGETAIMISE